MKYAICNETYVDWTHEDAFAHAAGCGYTGIEIAPFTLAQDIKSFSNGDRNRIRELATQNELEIIGLHWLLAKTQGLHLTSPDQVVRNRTADYLRELARLCQDLGGNVMVFGSPGQRNLADGISEKQGFEWAAEVFRSVVPALDEYEVTIALEPLGPEEGNFMLTAASGIELAERVDSSRVKLHLDVKAMSTEEKPVDQIIHESRDWMVHFHANDPNRRGPGMGDVDFEPIFSALREIDYDGWVSVEVFDYEPGVDRIAGESIEYMKHIATRLT